MDNALRGGSAGVNLIGNTDFWINYDDFERTHVISNTDETLKQSVLYNQGFGKGWVRFRRADGALSYMWTRFSGRNYFSVTKGRTYTFSVLVATNWNNELNYVFMRGENSPDITQTLHGSSSSVARTRERIGTVNGRGVYKHTYTFKADFTTSRGLMIFGLNNAAETTAGFYLSEWKLEEGDVATPYQEKLSGNNIISQINADETSMVISSSKVSITADDINIDGKTIQIGSNPAITSLKSDVTSASGLASTAKTQADAARDGDNIANSINSSSNATRVQGSRIIINGSTTFTDLSLPRKMQLGTEKINANALSEWGVTTISGGKIRTDEMTARRVKIVTTSGREVMSDGYDRSNRAVSKMSPHSMSNSARIGASGSSRQYIITESTSFIWADAFVFSHTARYLMVNITLNTLSSSPAVRARLRWRKGSTDIFSGQARETRENINDSGLDYDKVLVLDMGEPLDYGAKQMVYVDFRTEGTASVIGGIRVGSVELTDFPPAEVL